MKRWITPLMILICIFSLSGCSNTSTSLDEIENWCDDRYLMAYLEKLVELGCIKIYSRKMKFEDGVWKTRHFYYEPTIEFEHMDMMVRQYIRRYRYVIREQEEARRCEKEFEKRKLREQKRLKQQQQQSSVEEEPVQEVVVQEVVVQEEPQQRPDVRQQRRARFR